MRCDYRHRAFLGSNIFNPLKEPHVHDGTDQCWMVHVENDVTEFLSPNGQDTKRYCLFHVHHAPEEWTETKWDETSIGGKQSTRLKELLDQWNIENGKRKSNNEILLTFTLPGMQCGEVDFADYTFSHHLDFSDATFSGTAGFDDATFSGPAGFDDATFSGPAGFDDATFSGPAGFDGATFSDSAGFGGATFSGPAEFQNATFSGTATFADSTFMKEAKFQSSIFEDDGNFQRSTFNGVGFFQKTKFHKKALFNGSTQFHGAASFDEAEFGLKPYSSVSGIEANFDSAIFHNDLSFTGAKFKCKLIFTLANLEKGGRFTNSEIAFMEYKTHVGERLLFNNCSTLEALDFRDQDCSRLSFLNMGLEKVDFLGADVSKTRFEACWRDKRQETHWFSKVYNYVKSLFGVCW